MATRSQAISQRRAGSKKIVYRIGTDEHDTDVLGQLLARLGQFRLIVKWANLDQRQCQRLKTPRRQLDHPALRFTLRTGNDNAHFSRVWAAA